MEWLAAEPVLADYAFVTGQSATTGVGLYELNELRKWTVDKGKQLMSGRVVTPATNSKRREFQKHLRSKRNLSRRVLFKSSSSSRRGKSTPVPSATLTPPATMGIHGHSVHNSRGRGRYRSLLGRKPGSYSTRRRTFYEKDNTLLDKNSAWDGLVFLEKDTAGTDAINLRKGDLCKIHGVKMRWIFQLQFTSATDSLTFIIPIRVRWAIVIPKKQPFVPPTITAGRADTNVPNFFISPNPTTQQSTDFIQAQAAAVGGTHFDYLNRKINREEYGVVQEGQFILQNEPGANVGTGAGTNINTQAQKILHLYVKVNRQMKFATDAGAPEENMYFVHWYCFNGDDNVQNVIPTGVVRQQHEKTIYFTNSQMYR